MGSIPTGLSVSMPGSSSGLGRNPFKVQTGVRFSYPVLLVMPRSSNGRTFGFQPKKGSSILLRGTEINLSEIEVL